MLAERLRSGAQDTLSRPDHVPHARHGEPMGSQWMKKADLQLEGNGVRGQNGDAQAPCHGPLEGTVAGELHRRFRFNSVLAEDGLRRLPRP